jgi:hypothetical protein
MTTAGLLYQPQMIGNGNYEEIDGIKIGRKNRSARKKKTLPKHHFVHHKSHMSRPGFDPGPPLREAKQLCFTG